MLAAMLPASAVASDGTWERAWGKDVVTGGVTGFEICTVAATCKVGTTGGLGGELNGPTDVATDAAGNVYVAEFLNDRVSKFDAQGAFLRAWGKDVVTGGTTGFEICTVAADCKAGDGTGAELGGELDSPAAVTVDAAGNVYVADLINQRIQKFDSQGTWQRAWGKDVVTGGTTGFEICTTATANCKAGAAGTLGGEFSQPTGVATDTSGDVYVSDGGSDRIQKFQSSGSFLRTWGRDVTTGGTTGFEICTAAADCKAGVAGGLGGELNGPGGLEFGPAGSLYVAESTNQRIQRFDSSGNFERTWGKNVDGVSQPGTGFEICTAAASCQPGSSATAGAGEFDNPGDVATDATGSVYVSDNFNHRIQKFDGQGAFLRTWGRDVITTGTTGFEICPRAPVCQTGDPGVLGGELDVPSGVATNAVGDVYVADDDNSRIQRFVTAPQPPPPDPPEPSPEPEPKAARALTFDASKSKVKKGKKVTFSGRIDAPANEAGCEAGQVVELQRQAGTGAFETFAQLQSGQTGAYSATVKIKKTFTYRAQVAETEGCGQGVSAAEKVRAKKKKT